MNVNRLLSTVLVALAAACGSERPAIDRVQPNAIDKSLFAGEWYYQRTVVDAPAASTFTYIGSTDHAGLTRIRFDLQEDYLYARRTTEFVEGADLADRDDYEGEVVAAFRVESHFDIVRDYNATTGEELNVITENTVDRPWHERAYVRIDWSENLVHNYRLNFERLSIESVPYFVQAIDPETGRPHPDAPYFEPDQSYFDITSRIFAKARTVDIRGYGPFAICRLRDYALTECGPGEYSIRHSFAKIDPERQYKPLPYKGKQTEVFGYFTSDRLRYDAKTGIREQGRARFLTRHNLWQRWFDDEGKEIPPKDRALRPIVYHVNKDFPDDLKPVAHEVADQWNDVFSDAVRALGHEPDGRVFILCPNNPVRSGDPEACGAPGHSPRIGDLRYSFMAYIPKYMKYGLLGLGPSNNDPETGEIISGMAYVYHHNNLAAYRVQEMIELLNGTRNPKKFVDGVDLSKWLDTVDASPEESGRLHGLADAEHMVSKIAHGPAAQAWGGERQPPTAEDEAQQKSMGFDRWLAPTLDVMYQRGIANGSQHAPEALLANLKDSYIEGLLLDEEMLLAGGRAPGAATTEETVNAVSVARGGFGERVKREEKLRLELAEADNMFLPEMADDALIGLARELRGEDPDKVYELVRQTIYRAVLAHEVGHSVGLMHNFGGSDDAINYHNEYWEIRDDGQVASRLTDPMTDLERNRRLYDHAYSSIMDYAGRYTIDGRGLGKYDRAAILFGYAQKMEVFKDTADVEHYEFRDWYERDGDVIRFFAEGPHAPHYTSYYNRMGPKLYEASNRMLVDVEAFSSDFSTADQDGETYARVPYVYCSHSRANLGDNCLTRDYGADAYERMKNMLDDLNTWYIARNFPRGTVGLSHRNYVRRYYGRAYHRLKKWHDLYGLYTEILPRYYTSEQLEKFLLDSERGWGGKTWSVQNAFNYLVQTILAPEVGRYSGPFIRADGRRMITHGSSGGNHRVELGVEDARYFSTSWNNDNRECGYYWWECLHHVGFYLDKIMAIEALTDSTTNFVSRATPTDLRQWEISYYSSFPEQISELSRAIMAQDFSYAGPYYEDGRLRFPNFAGAMLEPHDPIEPFVTFTVQLYWQVLGQARFFSNYDQSFRDEARVFLMGTGAEPSLSPAERIEFQDPISGLTYAAVRYPDRMGSGQAVLDRAIRMQARSIYCDPGGRTAMLEDDCADVSDSVRAFVTPQFLDHLELVKVMADLSPAMSYGNPYKP